MLDLLHELLFNYTLRTVALGAATLGIVGGGLGTYAVLRGQSLLGDAISHAALPGIALAFLLTGSKAPIVLMLGAGAAGVIATLAILGVTETTRVKYDSALALMLAVFFGFGLVLLTYIQRHAGASQAGLDAFLFGQAAALIERDVVTMALLGGTALLVMGLFWKEFKLLAFDRAFGASLGLPMRTLDILLTTLLVIAIVIGLQTVGVVLMSAVIIAPAAAARQWTDRLGVMTGLAATFGAVSGVGGAVASASIPNLPTGPTIVLWMGILVTVSLLGAPNRGLLWQWWRDRRNARRLRRETVLLDLYALALKHDDPTYAHAESVLDAMNAWAGRTHRALAQLEQEGFVARENAQRWRLTDAGARHARTLAEERRLST
ncbi:metal ABC transporter permease [Salisaeta longa]|uniref:metal ABC transporter permease n=1 Tax=Salisaeta longa TaxID=503170 RepID=UPI0003B6B2BC|nr:metal ABC transporter permease [Salisaeta longa]